MSEQCKSFIPDFLFIILLVLKIDLQNKNKTDEILPILNEKRGKTIDIVGPLDKPTKDLMINYHKIMSLCGSVSYYNAL